MRPLVACLLLSLAMSALADEIVLKGGRSLAGEIAERTPTSVTVEIGPGRVTFPLAAIDHIVTGPSTLGTYRERARRLAAGDAAGWLALGYWAHAHSLATQANEAFERVIGIDPANEQAQQALGRVRVGDRWMTRDEGYRAQGLVQFQGEWLTPQERDARLAQQQTEAALERQRIESETRLREAEARARQAEAEARRAEAEAAGVGQPATPLVPLWMGAGFPDRHERDRGERAGLGHNRRPAPTPRPSPLHHPAAPPPKMQ
jgi:hypothetical protein